MKLTEKARVTLWKLVNRRGSQGMARLLNVGVTTIDKLIAGHAVPTETVARVETWIAERVEA